MSLNPKLLPPNMLRRMPKEERKKLGKDALLPEEREEIQRARIEKELQQQISAFLRRHEVPFFQQRTDKRSRGVLGWPDFSIVLPKPIFIECKTWNGKLRPEQIAMAASFEKWGHTIHVIRSYENFLILFREYNGGKIKTEKT